MSEYIKKEDLLSALHVMESEPDENHQLTLTLIQVMRAFIAAVPIIKAIPEKKGGGE